MPLTLTPPTKPGKAYVVVESSAGAPVQRDKIALDPYSGEVVESVRFTDGPLLAQLTTIGILAHTGTLFGSSSQIAMTAMALGILAVIFWGYRMWWQRRPTGGAPRPLERRGVLATTPQPVLFGLVLGAVLAGWLLPVFGASLVLFLLADTVVGRIARRRAGAGSHVREDVGERGQDSDRREHDHREACRDDELGPDRRHRLMVDPDHPWRKRRR